ncbi:MAG: beta-galactosidase [Armatimonadetes bacterium]|nr:beta-galactosidase [Armatimonadota bacterium]
MITSPIRRLRLGPRRASVALSALPALAALSTASAQTPALRTNPALGPFPLASAVDFRYLLDAPAGRHGFVASGKPGKGFIFGDGRRARFWGVNISGKSVFVPEATITRVADVLARAGCNMVRLEAIDSVGGLLDAPNVTTSRRLDEGRLALIDAWTHELRRRGIYYYFDLLDFRQFRADDGVASVAEVGRAARPYACFDRRLIALQKEYATQLLTHRNPRTGLRYVDDPALALVEVCNEHGLLIRPQALGALADPYAEALQRRWNGWLLARYGSRARMRSAWAADGSAALAAGEDPALGSVRLPDLSGPGRARVADGVRFCTATQAAYFAEMRGHLRSIGLRVPVTATVSSDSVADVESTSAMDFTAGNIYADHPVFAGRDWQGAFLFNDANPLRGASAWHAGAALASLRWRGKPLVVREWATVWPNRYRCTAVPEMAAYAALHDVDAVLLFGYQIATKPEELSDFDHQADPAVWGLFGHGAAAFLRPGAQAPGSVRVIHSAERLAAWPCTVSDVHRAGWFGGVDNRVGTAAAVAPTRATRAEAGMRGAVKALIPGYAPDRLATAAEGVYIALGGGVVRNASAGRMRTETPVSASLAGEMTAGAGHEFGPWRLKTGSPVAALMATSLDGKPFAMSRHYTVKMVTQAVNTGQRMEPAAAGAPARYRIADWGRPPVVTQGRASETATILTLHGRALLSLGMVDGTWELVVRDGRAGLLCDTGGISGTLFGTPITTVADQFVTAPATPQPRKASP